MNIIEHLMSILDLDIEARGNVPLTNGLLLTLLERAKRGAEDDKRSLTQTLYEKDRENEIREEQRAALEYMKSKGFSITTNANPQHDTPMGDIEKTITEIAKEGTKDEGYHVHMASEYLNITSRIPPYFSKNHTEDGVTIGRLYTKNEVIRLCSKAFKDGAWWDHYIKPVLKVSDIPPIEDWIKTNLKD